jgi:hypothetical protein
MDLDDQWELHTLNIKDATVEDAGEFELKAANRVGATTKRAKLLIVTEEPAFPTPLKEVTTQLGKTETFEAVVSGTPRPTVEWLRNGKELKKGKRVLFEEEPNLAGGFTYKFTIRDIVMKDFGQVFSIHFIIIGLHSYNRDAIFSVTSILHKCFEGQ